MIEAVKIQVRFADLDVLGHVNNSIYLSYFEMARVHYFNSVLGTNYNWLEEGFVLVKNEVEYLKPVYLNDDVRVSMAVEKIGNKSFTLSYGLSVNDELRSRGSSVMVGFNGNTHQSIELPDTMRQALEKLKAEQ